MNEARIQFGDNEKLLLQYSAGDLIPMLADNKKLLHVRQSSFDYYNKETEEHFQVHVMVTRDEKDFLDFLQTEEMSRYGD